MGIGKAVGGTVAAGLGLVGLGYSGLAGQDNTTRDESGAVVEGGEVGAFRIRVGDCLGPLELGVSFESVEAVPCSEPHQSEVFYAWNVPGDVFPGDNGMSEIASEGCYEAFSGFVGIAYEDSIYGYNTITPTAESWDQFDDREVQCLITDYNGGLLTGSAEGTAQ